MPGASGCTRIVLERRTGYVIPWWMAAVGVVASWAARRGRGHGCCGEILSGTFGGEETQPVAAASAGRWLRPRSWTSRRGST